MNNIENLVPGKETDNILAELINFVPLDTTLNSDGTFGTIPNYSTTWDGMGLITEALEKEGLSFSIQKTDENFECSVFDGYEADSLYFVQYSDKAPYAMALATIQALRRKSALNTN